GVDVVDTCTDVEGVVVLLLLFVGVERFAVAECPLALALALRFPRRGSVGGGFGGEFMGGGCHDVGPPWCDGARHARAAAAARVAVGWWVRAWLGGSASSQAGATQRAGNAHIVDMASHYEPGAGTSHAVSVA